MSPSILRIRCPTEYFYLTTAYDRSQTNCDEAQLKERLFGGHMDIN